MIRAKFGCWGVKQYSDQDGKVVGESVTFGAVTSSDPNDENHVWSQATPSGDLAMYISNPGAFGVFVQGQEYYLDFTPAE